MITQPTRILFATTQPAMVSGFRDVLRLAGFEGEPEMLHPREALLATRGEDAFLIFVDANRVPGPFALAKAVRRSPQSRFVLFGYTLAPEMLRMAVGSGMHGVLSTGLPAHEAAQALVRIWQGERQLRFVCASSRPATRPLSADSDFDAAWMFGQAG